MDQWSFDPLIANAIVRARTEPVETLREVAKNSISLRLSDGQWDAMRPRWEWHDSMSSDELQRRCGVKL